MPETRLNILSARSPNTETITTMPEISNRWLGTSVIGAKRVNSHETTPAVINPPTRPSKVLPGDTFGAILCLPIKRPNA